MKTNLIVLPQLLNAKTIFQKPTLKKLVSKRWGRKKKIRVGGKPSRNEVNRIRGQSEVC